MNTYTRCAIENANKRGMRFHIFDEKGYWHSSWQSYAQAVHIAKQNPGATLYNDSFEVIDLTKV
jgi:hypothetical protein